MSTGETSASGEAELQGPQRGLLFTGEIVDKLLPEQLAEIGSFARRMYGAEMRVVDDVRELGRVALTNAETDEPEPVLVDWRNDFYTLAAEHGFSKSLATRTRSRLVRRAERYPMGRDGDLPPFAIYDERGDIEAFDLRALYAHLYPAMTQRGFFSGSERQDAFLIAIVNKLVQPVERVPTERTKLRTR